MLSYYDHANGMVPKPVVVHDKQGVDDPHDNSSLNIDDEGRIWVFVSGRGRKRPGHIYHSEKAHDISSMKDLGEREFTYPQPWWIPRQGFALLFTKYPKGRELYCSLSDEKGETWTKDRKLAAMGGHYQVSNAHRKHVITAFNMHPGGKVDARTNLHFIQSIDGGKTWLDVKGEKLILPLIQPDGPGLVRDYRSEGRLVYMKDIGFSASGQPVILYLTSASHEPGPKGDPRIWTIARWVNTKWIFTEVTRSSHNYDMGSLYVESDGSWRIIGPTEVGPQKHGAGGEIVNWLSMDLGKTWEKIPVTNDSSRNHGYVRRPHHADSDFYGFWADGNPDQLSESRLYFTNRWGDKTRMLPDSMEQDMQAPIPYPIKK